jgi:hypothetical protein
MLDLTSIQEFRLRKSHYVPVMGLLINEEELVQSVMEQLTPLLNEAMLYISMCMLCISICTITYVFREFLKDKRERRLYAEQMKQLQRAGGERNKAE